jgi:uncharacterized protein (DUF1778 family)
MARTATRSTVINLRADERRPWSDHAAEAVGKNRSGRIDAATREATTVLLDRRFFQLDARAFKRFAAGTRRCPIRTTRDFADSSKSSLEAMAARSAQST